MTPYYTDDWLTVWQGDCREVMAQMPAESVHTVVTSPPYWGLRDYGTATWLGGDEGCDHVGTGGGSVGSSDKSTLTTGSVNGDWAPGKTIQTVGRGDCRKCGAVRQDSQLGLEPTPEEYVANMVAAFREVRRVLRADGTCWVNLGDSYGSGTTADRNPTSTEGPDVPASWAGRNQKPRNGLKPKDLVGIPWRVAFALQADGWYLRSDIIWSKPNPMPESVTDRPTKAHEYVFLLSKSPGYYFDSDAVREPAEYGRREIIGEKPWAGAVNPGENGELVNRHVTQTVRGSDPSAGRNLRSVWSIATQPYPGAHFATFPEKLVEPCVKAGTSERGVCPECGAPWRRVVERGDHGLALSDARPVPRSTPAGGIQSRRVRNTAEFGKPGSADLPPRVIATTGWRPSCAHELPPIPATVLDPFAGSGTTGRVAQRLGRRAVLIDLSGDYLVQAMERNREIPLSLSFSDATAGRVNDPDDEPSTDAA